MSRGCSRLVVVVGRAGPTPRRSLRGIAVPPDPHPPLPPPLCAQRTSSQRERSPRVEATQSHSPPVVRRTTPSHTCILPSRRRTVPFAGAEQHGRCQAHPQPHPPRRAPRRFVLNAQVPLSARPTALRRGGGPIPWHPLPECTRALPSYKSRARETMWGSACIPSCPAPRPQRLS